MQQKKSSNTNIISLPFDPGHQEVQTALDRGAVYETVNVESVDGLSVYASCAVTSCEEDEEEEEEEESKDGISYFAHYVGYTITQHMYARCFKIVSLYVCKTFSCTTLRTTFV